MEGSISLAMPEGAASPPEPVLELRPNLSFAARNALAARDVREGIGLWRLIWKLGWLDILLRYRGSVLGPFWLTLSTAIMIAALGFLYAKLFHVNLHAYLPFLALSIILWNFLSTLVSEACTCFTQAEGTIRSIRMPFFLYAGRMLVRNVLVLAHNLPVIAAIFLIFSVWPGMAGLYVLPAFALWLVDGIAVAFLLGAFCARFRDVPPIVASVMQIGFFVSPIIWQPTTLSPRWRPLLPINPFYTLLEVVRGPLLGQAPAPVVWLSAVGYSAAICGLSWLLLVRARHRVAFWI
ncbi:MAG: ABC transporter permease [Rhodospirillales bacterium]|nr:ABC transporter permease [Rhodospirillales bacterium]